MKIVFVLNIYTQNKVQFLVWSEINKAVEAKFGSYYVQQTLDKKVAVSTFETF